MTKAELIEKMANDAGISKVAAGAALNSIINNIGTSLKKKVAKSHCSDLELSEKFA